MRFFLALVLIFIGCDGQENKLDPKKSDAVTIQIQWKEVGLPLKMQIHEVRQVQPMELWTTGSVKFGNPAPFEEDPIADGIFYLSPGQKKQFLLVMKNESPNTIYFFASPHQAHPMEHSLGFKFKCLCINHIFVVPSQSYWYRVVELRLSPDFLGDKLSIEHALVGVTESRYKSFLEGGKEPFATND